MTDSLELYKDAVRLATNSPLGTKTYAENADRLKNYYLQLVTTTFYELTTRRTSPLISALCRVEKIPFTPKNFNLSPAQAVFNHHTNFDLYLTVHGLNVALTGNLAACQKLYEQNATKIFRKEPLSAGSVQELLNQLTALDAGIGKFFAAERVVERIVEKRVEVPVERVVERVVEVLAAQEDDLIQNLHTIAANRQAADEKIIDELKKVQLALQNESPPPQDALNTILNIRDAIDFKATEEPINQLWLLFDKLNEILQRHPMPDTAKGYERLIRRCKNFSRYVEQSLAMLGAEVINETAVPFDPAKHTIINDVRPTESSTVTNVLNVGVTYKGHVRRKADVEIAEPSGGDSQ